MVGNLEAACHSLNCAYMFDEDNTEITSFSLNGREITINGVDLPTDRHVRVEIGGV